MVPSGASVGDYEAHELRDGNPTVYGGNSVMKAVHNVENVIGPALIEKKFDVAHDLVKIDQFVTQLDGTKDKSRLGANAILGISMECARAGAAAKVCLHVKPGEILTKAINCRSREYHSISFCSKRHKSTVILFFQPLSSMCSMGASIRATRWRSKSL